MINGIFNSLTKDFLICDGNTINFDNYQNINILNTNLFKLDSNGFKPLLSNGKPTMKDTLSGVYKAIKNSQTDFKTPELLKIAYEEETNSIKNTSRYIRGLNWCYDTDNCTAITNITKLTNNTTPIKTYSTFPSIWSKKKDIHDVAVYKSNYGFNQVASKHYHLMFYSRKLLTRHHC